MDLFTDQTNGSGSRVRSVFGGICDLGRDEDSWSVFLWGLLDEERSVFRCEAQQVVVWCCGTFEALRQGWQDMRYNACIHGKCTMWSKHTCAPPLSKKFYIVLMDVELSRWHMEARMGQVASVPRHSS